MYNLFARMKSYVPTTRRFLLDFNKSFKFFHPAIIWHFFSILDGNYSKIWQHPVCNSKIFEKISLPPLYNIYFQGHFFMIRYIEYWQQNNVIQCVHNFYLLCKTNCNWQKTMTLELPNIEFLSSSDFGPLFLV